MIDEKNQLDETQASASESSATGDSNAQLPDNGADSHASQVPDTAAESTAAESSQNGPLGDDTDYQAAFSDLRATYAAKEREAEALRVQLEDLNHQYLRMTADFENFRRRTQKEKEDLELQVKCSTLTELLPVVDNFDRARSQIKPQNDGEAGIHKSYQGVYKDMVDRLKKIGVVPMRSEGKEFDPNLHEAVMREPTHDYAEGTVLEELMRGYQLGERVLRHAMVKVAAPAESSDSDGAAPEAVG
jgi:molecular chaperone GrpE